MRSFSTWRGGIVGIIGVLESSLTRSLRASVVGRGRCRRLCFALMLVLHLLHLGLALDFGFKSGLSVGVDRLLGEIVGSAAGYGGWLVFYMGISGIVTGPWPEMDRYHIPRQRVPQPILFR